MAPLYEPHAYPGRLIVVEGIDGSGKSTQLSLLHTYLVSEGYDVSYTEWNSSPIVKDTTRRGKRKNLFSPTTFSLIHATDFADRHERSILPPLRAGFIVLADRWAYTAFARDADEACRLTDEIAPEHLHIATENADVRDLYDTVMAHTDLSAGLQQWNEDWVNAFQNNGFAVMLAPSWMLGVISGNAEGVKGWDVAPVFPGGGGNWGGSFLTVPTQSAHPKEAQALAEWLTAPKQQLVAFKTTGKYACACGPKCDCDTISQKAAKCACGKEMKEVK